MFLVAAGISAEQFTRHCARGYPAGRPEERDLGRRRPIPLLGSGGPALAIRAELLQGSSLIACGLFLPAHAPPFLTK